VGISAPRRIWRPASQHGTRGAPRFWALRDVSFQVAQGEVVGIIGHNGAGKSTLLRILSRVTNPSRGRIVVRGRVGSLLEVGAGFHPELTGRENIFLYAAMLGMSRAQIHQRFDEIVDFAGVAPFLETPLKRFSSGMWVRLAFSVAAHVEPDILILDEAMAVGDGDFRRKCYRRTRELVESGRTVLLVSHQMSQIEALCQRVIVLEHGRLIADMSPQEAIELYTNRNMCRETETQSDALVA